MKIKLGKGGTTALAAVPLTAVLMILSLLLFFKAPVVQANVGEAFGLGARNAALGGAGVAGGQDGFSAYLNPAALSLDQEKRLHLSYGLVFMQPNFKPIRNVVVQNSFIADNAEGAPTYGDVDTGYKSTFGQVIGIGYRLFPERYNLSLGLTAFMPVAQVAFMDTGEAYVPEYVLYRARTQRPQFDLGMGAELGSGLRVGAGIHFGFALTSNATAFLSTTTTVSSMRFTSSLKPKAAPYFGILFSSDDPEAFSLGAVLRMPLASDNTMVLSSAARAFGNLAAVDFDLTGSSALFYDPMSLEVGTSFRHFGIMKFYGQVEYQFWSNFQAPAIQITQSSGTGQDSQGLRVTQGALPTYGLANILVPRLGEEIQLSDNMTLRFGYAYRASIFKGISNGSGNYLDPDKHMANAGIGFRFSRFLGYDQPWTLDLNLAYQALVAQKIVKTSGNEAGAAGDFKVGYPGYEAGGNLLGGGLSLSWAL